MEKSSSPNTLCKTIYTVPVLLEIETEVDELYTLTEETFPYSFYLEDVQRWCKTLLQQDPSKVVTKIDFNDNENVVAMVDYDEFNAVMEMFNERNQ